MRMLFPRYVWLTYSDESGALLARDRPHCAERALDEAIDGLFTMNSVYNEVSIRCKLFAKGCHLATLN